MGFKQSDFDVPWFTFGNVSSFELLGSVSTVFTKF